VSTGERKSLSWLRWQPIKFSPWLLFYLLFVFISVWLIEGFHEQFLHGGTLSAAFSRIRFQRPAAPFMLYFVYGGLANLFLLWFTFFSRSPRVKDHDKFAVFLMLSGALVGWIILLARVAHS